MPMPSVIDDLTRRLMAVANCLVIRNQPLADYTSYHIGGPAALFLIPENEHALITCLKLIDLAKVPLFIIGHGSNVLVSDKGWPGVALHFGAHFSGYAFEGSTALVKSGTRLIDLVRAATAKGLSGLEQLAGIPGSVGGALRMNAGAFGQEIQNITESVSGAYADGSTATLHRSQISFGYRCAPELDQLVITHGRFRFGLEEKERLRSRLEEILALRAKKQPLDFPSCGSVFKRPPGYYAGALIEEADLKGERIGDAVVSPKHCGFIVNVGRATARDVFQLIRMIETRVYERFGVKLEREVRLVGDFEEA